MVCWFLSGPFDLPSHLTIHKLENIKNVPIPTFDIKVSPYTTVAKV